MGTERGGPIPVKMPAGRGYKEDRDGNKVITKLDQAQLETLARQQTESTFRAGYPSGDRGPFGGIQPNGTQRI